MPAETLGTERLTASRRARRVVTTVDRIDAAIEAELANAHRARRIETLAALQLRLTQRLDAALAARPRREANHGD